MSLMHPGSMLSNLALGITAPQVYLDLVEKMFFRLFLRLSSLGGKLTAQIRTPHLTFLSRLGSILHALNHYCALQNR